MKAPATYPDEIFCGHCGTVCPWPHPDIARRHGWRISWTPTEKSWCPDCYGVTRPPPRVSRNELGGQQNLFAADESE